MKDPNYQHRPLVAMSTTGRLQPAPPKQQSQPNRPRVRLQVQVSPQESTEIQPDQPLTVEDNPPLATEASYGITAPTPEESAVPTPVVVKKPFHFLKTLFAR
jgi:hypothetical protein